MSEISAEKVKALREKTGLGMMKCKEALLASGGDDEKAIEYLRKQGLKTADKKSGRATEQGWIGSYVHSNGKVGVLVEVACESDFVAKGDDFQGLLKDLCLQITAMKPLAVGPDDVPEKIKESERAIYREQVKDKPDNIVEKILDGKMKAFYKERCLLQQEFVKDSSQTVQDMVTAVIAKVGENITVRRFVRMEFGAEA